MSDNIFLDTNILVYTYSKTELDKKTTARQLVINNNSFISTQVLQELTNTITKKFKYNYTEASKAIKECSHNSILHINTEVTILDACRIASRYGYSFYDSLIISAALECGCTELYTEDMQDEQIIDKRLTIHNPFK